MTPDSPSPLPSDGDAGVCSVAVPLLVPVQSARSASMMCPAGCHDFPCFRAAYGRGRLEGHVEGTTCSDSETCQHASKRGRLRKWRKDCAEGVFAFLGLERNKNTAQLDCAFRDSPPWLLPDDTHAVVYNDARTFSTDVPGLHVCCPCGVRGWPALDFAELPARFMHRSLLAHPASSTGSWTRSMPGRATRIAPCAYQLVCVRATFGSCRPPGLRLAGRAGKSSSGWGSGRYLRGGRHVAMGLSFSSGSLSICFPPPQTGTTSRHFCRKRCVWFGWDNRKREIFFTAYTASMLGGHFHTCLPSGLLKRLLRPPLSRTKHPFHLPCPKCRTGSTRLSALSLDELGKHEELHGVRRLEFVCVGPAVASPPCSRGETHPSNLSLTHADACWRQLPLWSRVLARP